MTQLPHWTILLCPSSVTYKDISGTLCFVVRLSALLWLAAAASHGLRWPTALFIFFPPKSGTFADVAQGVHVTTRDGAAFSSQVHHPARLTAQWLISTVLKSYASVIRGHHSLSPTLLLTLESQIRSPPATQLKHKDRSPSNLHFTKQFFIVIVSCTPSLGQRQPMLFSWEEHMLTVLFPFSCQSKKKDMV